MTISDWIVVVIGGLALIVFGATIMLALCSRINDETGDD